MCEWLFKIFVMKRVSDVDCIYLVYRCFKVIIIYVLKNGYLYVIMVVLFKLNFFVCELRIFRWMGF